MRLKKVVAGLGLTGALAAGMLALSAGPASADSNTLIRTYYSDSWDHAQAACQTDANSGNSGGNGRDFYYCSQADSYDANGQTFYGYNLWHYNSV